MPSNIKVSGTDLDSIFAPRTSSAGANVGVQVSGTDIANRYELSTGGDTIGFNTNIKSGGNDLRNIFRDISYVTSPIITSNPNSDSGNEGDSFSFSVSAIGAATLTYQWRKNGSDISAATSSTYNLPGSTVYTDSGSYDVVVSNSYGSATSSAATLTVHRNPYIISDPTDITDDYGANRSLTVVAGGDGISYQWYHDLAPISGATSSTYTMNPLVYTDAGSYFCRVSSSFGAPYVDSNGRVVIVNSIITITSQPSDLDIQDGVGGPYAIIVGATGYGTIHYQWYKDSSPISGATFFQHVGNPFYSNPDFGFYFCRVTDDSSSGGNPHVDSSIVHIYPYPIIDTQPYDATGAGLNWSNGVGPYGVKIDAHSSAGVHYQWYHDGSPIGSDNDQHVVNPAVFGDAGQYWCIITDGNGLSVESSHVTVTVT